VNADDVGMTLSTTAARVMSLAQDGHTDDAVIVARRALEQVDGTTAEEQAALWYSIAVTHHVRGDSAAQVAASDRCLALAEEAGNPGWAANALTMRAMAQARDGAVEPALLDLARAEVSLAACEDPGLRSWTHTGLGYCHLELRLYELAQPHFEAAVREPADPIPLAESSTIDLMNLAELHLRWADELERVHPHHDDVGRHRRTGHRHAVAAVAEARRVGAASFVASCEAMELASRPLSAASESLAELRAAFASPLHREHQGGRASVGGALARALWALDQRDEALAVARESARQSESAGDWQVAASARWLLVELESAADVPGAAAGRAYGQLLSRVLWQQRLSTLQGARAALDVERLRRDNEIALRAAAEDPLTGVGNRRALQDALAAAVRRISSDGAADTVFSALLVDLDAFKAVNDVHGHVVGDEVLRAVAAALRSVARSQDVVVRLGGDEFVVFAEGVDEAAGRLLAARATQAIAAVRLQSPAGTLVLRASVGVATTGEGVGVGDLLQAADAAMYRVKGRHEPQRRGA
jgi:diguanylate cyclase (GGDEF)-like protein